MDSCCLRPQRILKLDYQLPPHVNVSPEARNLLSAMLVAQPEGEARVPLTRSSFTCIDVWLCRSPWLRLDKACAGSRLCRAEQTRAAQSADQPAPCA